MACARCVSVVRVDGVTNKRSDFVPTTFGAARARSMSCLVRWNRLSNRLRGPWICLLDAFYYHSDGLERPSITSGRVGVFPSVLPVQAARYAD